MANIRTGRRDILRGLGAGAALLGPLARVKLAWGADAPAGNLAIFYTPNGFVRDKYTFTGALTGAAKYQNQTTIVEKMKCSATSSKESHEDIVKILTCVKGGGLYDGMGPSIDWVVADHFQQQPLTLAALGSKGPAWNTKLSWKTTKSFTPHTNSPAEAFKTAFAAGVPTAMPTTPTTPTTPSQPPAIDKSKVQRKSVLDFIRGDIETFRARLSATDKAKLGDHLDVIRGLEVRYGLGTPSVGGGGGGGVIAPAPAASCNPKSGTGGSLQGDVEAHLDLIAASFACGVRRSATLLTQPASSGQNPLGSGNHHDITHDHNMESWAAIDKWYGDRFGYFLGKLESLGILDRTVVVWCSEIEQEHQLDAMKWAIAGGSALGLKHSGATITAPDVGNVWVTVKKALGLPGDKHGDITGTIPGLI